VFAAGAAVRDAEIARAFAVTRQTRDRTQEWSGSVARESFIAQCFGQYRAFDASIVENQERKNTRLTLPVLAIGGEEALGQGVIDTMKLVADDVLGVILPGTGHWVAEQAPEQLVATVTPFLAPYRDASERVAAIRAGS
jgi:pimeloyl-ACP methyl ester carboxylesterase